jgi:hypothetical protein
MSAIPVNQSVDVHWQVVAGANVVGAIPGAEHIRKFDCLIAAARFAIQKSAEGNEKVKLYLAVGPAMTAEQAMVMLGASGVMAGDGEIVVKPESGSSGLSERRIELCENPTERHG